MSDFKNAIQDLYAIGKRTKGIVDLIPYLENIDSLSNKEVELTNSIVSLEKKKEEYSLSLSEVQDSIKALELDASVSKEEALRVAKDIVSDAKNKASDIVSNAKDTEDKIKVSCEEINNRYLSDVSIQKSNLDSLKDEVSVLEDTKNSILKEIASLKARF